MHRLIQDHLEEVLEGKQDGAIQAHLAACRECREQVEGMSLNRKLLQVLRDPEESEPAPGFYARVVSRIESMDRASFWDLLLDPVFGRRLVFASLALVVFMGTYLLLYTPARNEVAFSPEAIMAAPATDPQQALGADPQRDREVVLVSLAALSE
jgi:predicted anti-sigma-YlaC factor YlaD